MALQHSPSITTNGLILCLDAGNRESYPGSGNTWYDLAGSYNGTLTNGPTFSAVNCGTLVFDGTNDYVTCGQVLNFGNTTSVGTILIWAKGKGDFFSNQRPGAGDNNHGWILATIEANRFVLDVDSYSSPPYGEYFSAPLSTTPYTNLSSQWNFYSIRINRPANQYSVGINQYITDYTRSFTVQNYVNFNIIELGRFYNSSYALTHFQGQIANVAIYNRYLTTDEILQNYNAMKGRYNL